uniref:protein-serine/threonine phosphatase n=1 Tax=Corethron hystrix TaxID=216773 RepID=A0A6U5FM03_9STRA|mmetsp:Transcript_23598/g.53874  ORF Transcript_23598/g.53874 Transcript_23598/m.53874 type:complete len:305 (+) Transcript_23598:214-1128(+)
MGTLLDKPVTEKNTELGESNGLKYGASSMQGWRVEMEDEHILATNLPKLDGTSFFAVFDGHGGSFTSYYAKGNLVRLLSETESYTKYVELSQEKRDEMDGLKLFKSALEQAFLNVDVELRETPEHLKGDRSGCTSIAVAVTPKHIICANAGDSRACYCKGGAAVPLSYDHKPTNSEEHNRIDRAGGYVSMRRVDGDLAVSRALGDLQYKTRNDLPAEQQKVTALPDFIVHERDNRLDEYIIIACDGIWDVVSNDESVEIVSQIFMEGEKNIGFVCEEVRSPVAVHDKEILSIFAPNFCLCTQTS